MDFETLRDKYKYLGHDQWQRYTSMFERIEVSAKTTLLREGDIARNAYWIAQGCIRLWFNNNGRDATFQFFFEGQGIASLESFMNNVPSFFTVETLEPCILYRISRDGLLKIMDELGAYPEYNGQALDFLAGRQFHYMQEFLSFIKDTPVQRYQRLLQERPHIIQRVPQHYIAAYLGITSVSLSRIRSRLIKER